MRVERLAILGVMSANPVRDRETKEGAFALLSKYLTSNPDMPVKLQFVSLGQTANATDWNALEDRSEGGGERGYFSNTGGRLGVYVLAHGSMAGLEGVVDEAKFYVMLKHFNLLTVQKLCLIACCGGLEALDRQGQVVGNPSVLRRLCEYLGTQGCTPKMAGWKSFVTVVNEAMFKTSAEDTKPFELGSYSKARKSGALVDPEEHRGRKAIDGPRSAKILASNPLSENTTKTKVFYTYQDGATRVAYQDWTDKPL